MSVPQKLRDLAISETGFVFDPYTGSTFSVNETGLALLTGLRDGQSVPHLVARLAAAFEVGTATDLARDVDDFIQLLRTNGLVPEHYTP